MRVKLTGLVQVLFAMGDWVTISTPYMLLTKCFFLISCDIALRWMSLDLTYDKSTLVQVMAWCRQATSPDLSQCWPTSVTILCHQATMGYRWICLLWYLVSGGTTPNQASPYVLVVRSSDNKDKSLVCKHQIVFSQKQDTTHVFMIFSKNTW